MDSSLWDNPHTCDYCQFYQGLCRAPALLQTEEWAEWRQYERDRIHAGQVSQYAARFRLGSSIPLLAPRPCPSWWPPGWPVRLARRDGARSNEQLLLTGGSRA